MISDKLIASVDDIVHYYKKYYPKISQMISQCFLNTIETTVKELDDGKFFVITGDIPAMWLRDSSAQMKHYIPFAADDEELKKIFEGVIAQQVKCINIDPYANAFNSEANGNGFSDDETDMNPNVWERKYEVDSLCGPIFLAYEYWIATRSEKCFTEEFFEALERIYKIFKLEQHHENSLYRFHRPNTDYIDTLPKGGMGTPVGYTGMTWSGFRPSDDTCTYGYLIPSNMMAFSALNYAAQIIEQVYKKRADKYILLAEEIKQGIEKYGIVDHPKYGKIYAYETDGLGNYNLMDDANYPSLLSAPYIGYCKTDDNIYQNTRKFILSSDNKYYFSGKYAEGIGSPHTLKNYVWHISLVMQILTSTDDEEILKCLEMIANTTADTNFMHESFDVDDPVNFSRAWFAWANSIFAEMTFYLKEKAFFEKTFSKGSSKEITNSNR